MILGGYMAPKSVWLPAEQAWQFGNLFTTTGTSIWKQTANKVMHSMTDFAVQFNKNNFGIIPSTF